MSKGRLNLKVKRAYDPPQASDGRRLLVDRIWPRGVKKDELPLDGWVKDVAPSTQLRKWYGHDPAKWATFQSRYFRELAEQPDAIKSIRAQARKGTVTLVFAARDVEHSHAVALKKYLEGRAG
jgi:uncharacterized protein YeaO (DUF488 family)